MRGPGTTTVEGRREAAQHRLHDPLRGAPAPERRARSSCRPTTATSRAAAPRRRSATPGTIRRTATGETTVDLRVPVENDGTVVSDGGLLLLSNGGSDGSVGQLRRRRRHGAPVERRVAARPGRRAPDRPHDREHDRDDPRGGTVSATGATAMSCRHGQRRRHAGDRLRHVHVVGRHDGGRGHDQRRAPAPRSRCPAPAACRSARRARSRSPASPTSRPTAAWALSGAGAAPVLHVAAGGVLRKSGGTNWSYVSVPVRNDGTRRGPGRAADAHARRRAAAHRHVPGHVRDRARRALRPGPRAHRRRAGSTTSPRSPARSPCAPATR